MSNNSIFDVTFLYSPEHPEHVMEFLKYGQEKYKGHGIMRPAIEKFGSRFPTTNLKYIPTIRYPNEAKTMFVHVEVLRVILKVL